MNDGKRLQAIRERRFRSVLLDDPLKLPSIGQLQLRALVRVRYVKVAEYQARGAVHFHAVIRLDAPGDGYQPPPVGIDADLLGEAIRQAVSAVRITTGDRHGAAITLGFGAPQGTDVRPIRRDDLAGTGRPLSHQAVANYIAKYATKTLTAPGLPTGRLESVAEIAQLRCNRHYQAMIGAAWALGIRKWAHTLGYGGHFLTKSRHYSVTFGQLRKARAEYRKKLRQPYGDKDPWGRDLDETTVLIIKTWQYTGTGYLRSSGARQAAASEARAREHD